MNLKSKSTDISKFAKKSNYSMEFINTYMKKSDLDNFGLHTLLILLECEDYELDEEGAPTWDVGAATWDEGAGTWGAEVNQLTMGERVDWQLADLQQTQSAPLLNGGIINLTNEQTNF